MPTPWEDDPADAPKIAVNVAKVLTGIAAAAHKRDLPTVAMTQQWHRDCYEGIARPFDYYAGEVRDSDERFPDLIGYEVHVGGMRGVPSAQVPHELERFEQSAQTASSRLDAVIAAAADPSAMVPAELHGVLTFCAVLHGSWVRIHPFANGNGRTARLWANWAALRYGLPPFVTIKPRPRNRYGVGAGASMAGDDQVMVGVMHQMLLEFLAGL